VNDTFHEEEKLGKVYDSRLMRRLLQYTKPHRLLILLSILIVLLITASELAGPYLIKIAIDDHINALDEPMVAFEPDQAPTYGTPFEGKVLIREKMLKEGPPFWKSWFGDDPAAPSMGNQKNLYQILEYDQHSYLIHGAIDPKQVQFNVYPANEEPAGSNRRSGPRLSENNALPFSDPLVRSAGWTLITDTNEAYAARLLTKEELALFRDQDVSALMWLGGIYLVLVTAAFVLGYVQTYSLHYVAQKIIHRMRKQIFSHLQGLSFSFFDRNPVGRLVTRVTNDTETLNEMYSNVLVNLFKDLFILVGIMIIMLQLNVQLALLAFTTLPLIIVTTILYKRMARDAFREVRTMLARINASMNENITGMRIVHIFKREKQQFDQFEKINKRHYDVGIRELQLASLFRPAMDFIYAIGLALLIWYGGAHVVQGAIEFGVLYAFIDYINRFFKPINDMTEKYTIMQQAMTSSERIFLLLDEKDSLPDPTHPRALQNIRGEIEFKDVSFAYNEGEWVLRDINFKVNPGETVAFVGATGAGKSSIISLLTRFYDIQKGSITVDGTDVRDVRKSDLRQHIGVVLQDVFLFAGDIESNIRLNNESISDRKIREVADYVNASSFIRKLSNGYKEAVMERGSTLSAGQRQLLAFARTLAFNPSILVLDEATANIDTETELLIQDAMKKVSYNRTTLIIAHRLSTIQHADKIIVLHKGSIREMGKHQELLKQGGLYHKLYELQYKDQLQTDSSIESLARAESHMDNHKSTGTSG
jgi:ATP-binding cassette subfamily B multidrug efflux pump